MSAVASRVSEIHLKEPQNQVNPTLSLLLAEVPPLESIAKAFTPLLRRGYRKILYTLSPRRMSQKPLHPLPREGEGRGEGG